MLVAGCYERFLFGYSYKADTAEESATIVKTFNYPAHKGPVKCIAAAGNIIASGGTDDLIHLYDVQKGRDLGFLMNPGDGAVTTLDFHRPAGGGAPSHLLNGSADGSISVWQGGSWDCLKTMEGHKGAINSISVHPAGSVALSVGRDRELRVWNLVKGRVTYHSKLAAEAEQVAFDPSGDRYALVVGRAVSLHAAQGGGEQLADLPHHSRVLTTAFCGAHGLLAGCEDGSLRLWDTRASRAVAQISKAHSTRIRGVAALGGSSQEASEGGEAVEGALVASASTDGTLRLWDLRAGGSSKPLTEVNSSARLTCLCHVSPSAQQHSQKPALLKQQLPKQQEAQAEGKQQPKTVPRKQGQQAAQQQPKGSAAGKIKAKQPPDRAVTGTAAVAQVKRKKGSLAAKDAAPAAAQKKAKKEKIPEEDMQPAVSDSGVVKRGLVEFAASSDDEGLRATAVQPVAPRAGGGKGGKSQRRPSSVDLSRFD